LGLVALACEAKLVAAESGALSGGDQAVRALAEEAQTRGLGAIARRALALLRE
jgi:hypothetical protein